MKPLQVWLPTFDPALASAHTRRDLERAQLSWTDQITVWTFPENGEVKTWACPDQEWATESAIQGERLNRFDVFHVGRDGYVQGRRSCGRFPGEDISELLGEWLNVESGDPEKIIWLAPVGLPDLSFRVPDFKDGKMGYRNISIVAIQPGGSMPAVLKETATTSSMAPAVALEASWPPANEQHRVLVSPSAESEARFGPWDTEFVNRGGMQIPTLISRQDPKLRSGLWRDVWPGNLQRFFPFGGGLDAIHANRKMRQVAALSLEDPARALSEARDRSTRFLSTARATKWNTWFLPILARNGVEEALFAIDANYSLDFGSLEEAMVSEEFRERMRDPVEIQRALGVLGLFWALLIEQLEEGHSFQSCEWCHRLMRARPNKKFCGKRENPDCRRDRRAANQRQRRSRSKK